MRAAAVAAIGLVGLALIGVVGLGRPVAPSSPGTVAGVPPRNSASPATRPERGVPAPAGTASVGRSPGSSAAATLPPSAQTGPGHLEMTTQRLRVWHDRFGEVRAQVLAIARNAGGSPVRVRTGDSTWTVRNETSGVVASGRFAHAFPPVVLPGGTLYLIDGISATLADPDELDALEVEISGDPQERDADHVTLGIAALSWRGVEDGGLEVSGTITNATNASVRESTVGIVLRDAAGELLGGVYDIALGPLDAGESRVFVTDYPATPPIVVADVASAEAAAAGISE